MFFSVSIRYASRPTHGMACFGNATAAHIATAFSTTSSMFSTSMVHTYHFTAVIGSGFSHMRFTNPPLIPIHSSPVTIIIYSVSELARAVNFRPNNLL